MRFAIDAEISFNKMDNPFWRAFGKSKGLSLAAGLRWGAA